MLFSVRIELWTSAITRSKRFWRSAAGSASCSRNHLRSPPAMKWLPAAHSRTARTSGAKAARAVVWRRSSIISRSSELSDCGRLRVRMATWSRTS
ncbi:MAG: hypothetical protein AW07_02144 [Candidatus Accumulibacter sp. SK-11]|nr:MAG: hypothetical protein AW07_02144 [Candidatus Accumulibacter sp. SK-11]